ncbi:Bug family tripartite tricarboxylate transporter substrate binding protein [Bordetella bronchiseptica]|uniref:Tripartite tricarboxylate transporter family receptor domain protein n=2 Tax=Bordetella bronchiseptica TaxID=518 RepID=A0ABR4R7A7_BORBO|nr:tripartite tricarboxylate transporter substrate binding protein [Bordetella bronchiseptica]SHS21000.1 periplasmic solute-binding protein [Mycobacteroides abscessus subsp. abscessus]AZW20390.1 tripartite tricarboxylate transporter substrate binding protein [Bordetella bronchiseptica]KCV30609.1 tripartite tricarboxylate transporter family receptor domain protein [Bordetella bronchiseptica 00-P-2796]KDC05940.1 tripartite tricarboxylate transporter family receptor domain protein [Bordetella bron
MTVSHVLRVAGRALLAACLLATPAVQAAGYPDRPVRLLVGFAPGGPTDLAARLVAKHLGADLGQAFIVENRAGAGGNIATKDAAGATPDGYTGLVAGINITINPWMTADMHVDSRKDLLPVRIVAIAPTILVVRNDFPARDFQEFLREVRKHPDTYNSAAPGSSPLLATELFSQQTGTRITPVPTFAELGMQDFRFDAWAGVLMPAGTPPAVIDTLARSLDKLAGSAEFEAQVLELGMKPVVQDSPSAFARTIDTELGLYKTLAQSVRGKIAQ